MRTRSSLQAAGTAASEQTGNKIPEGEGAVGAGPALKCARAAGHPKSRVARAVPGAGDPLVAAMPGLGRVAILEGATLAGQVAAILILD
jgi:hypothetical protein